MSSPETPTPGKGGPNRRLAAQIDAREYRRSRPGPILLMGAAVVADAGATQHRFLLPLNAGADADGAPAPARAEPGARP